MVWLLATLIAQGALADTTTVDVMSFNVRYDNPGDGVHAWAHRKEHVAAIMLRADVVGVQEALMGQVLALDSLLTDYSWFGVGRDDGKTLGEFTPVFYRSSAFILLDHGTFWLSETPSVAGSVGWDAALPRIATWGRLTHTASGTTFWIINVHFDHRGRAAREESAGLLFERAGEMAGNEPVIVTGDFNAAPGGVVYNTLTQGRLADTRRVTRAPPKGPRGTFSGFTVDQRGMDAPIDYVFADRMLAVLSFEVIESVLDGLYASDHRPVLVRVAF